MKARHRLLGVLSALLSRSHHLPGLLAAPEEGRVPVGAVDARRRRQLARHREVDIRRRPYLEGEGTIPREETR